MNQSDKVIMVLKWIMKNRGKLEYAVIKVKLRRRP